MSHKGPDTDRIAECTRAIEEINASGDTLTAYELYFVKEIQSRIEEFGERSRITEREYHSLQNLYERVC